ncbi:MAG: hypothetical protein BWY63_01331 [Chloroflexi bacterium ADurb.Bin360]|nr:MAG: hypothetical protein BWY63_01331 [Chloroflexi bacterium ADurb.Bin360]
MTNTAIIIPTLDAALGKSTGDLALLSAGMDARLIVVAGPKRGFTATVNDGLVQLEPGEDACILNDDVHWFTHGWLNILSRALHSAKDIAMVCPTGKSRTAPMAKAKTIDTGLENVGHIPFWCVLVRSELLSKLGHLDPRYIHYCSDNDYCDRAQAAGWRNVWVKDVWLEHRVHGSGMIADWAHKDLAEYNRTRTHNVNVPRRKR